MSQNNYSLKITPKASEDLENIYRYLSKELHPEKAADNLLSKIETNIMTLKKFPFSCNYVSDEFLKSKGYRNLIIDNYIAFYLVNEGQKQVIIMRVLYGKQKYEYLL